MTGKADFLSKKAVEMENSNPFGSIKTFQKSQLIFDDKISGNEMYILRRGKVRLVLGGKEGVEIGTVENAGDFFGEMALVDGSLRSATAIAGEDDTELEALDRASFLEMIKINPEFALRVMHRLSDSVRLGNERRLAEEKLKQTMAELDRSNKELEQFAYVTSHDLREPLRMMTSFSQSLEKRYKGRLDKTADEYIGFIVDGAARMQKLIDDILLFSRVTTRALPFESVEMEKTLQDALVNLRGSVEDAKAIITHDPLPLVQVDPSQMVQVMQNLIGNAIKFHRKGEPPKVHISARQAGKEWVFSIKDNGIGIDPELFGRLFNLFQRLHPQNEYPGSGVGLAVTKKIIQRHQGRIWVESQPDMGSTFYFTIPAAT
jgi:signal transduction histidine kinase